MSTPKYIIVSDGTVAGTKITVNGNEVIGATSIVFESHSSDKEVDVKIRFFEKENKPQSRIGF